MAEQVGQLSERDLAGIVERSSTFVERLSDGFSPVDIEDTSLMDARIEAWCQAVAKGDWDRFRLRLAWDGLDLEMARRALGPARLRQGATLPEWSGLLSEALRLAPIEHREGKSTAWPVELSFLDAEEPLPFEEILAPLVLAARKRLVGRTITSGDELSEPVRAALERGLLRSLVTFSAETLLAEFEAMRAQEQSSWSLIFALAQDPDGRSLYLDFVRRMAEGGLSRLFLAYPVLARQLGTTACLWVEATGEFLGRLEADRSELGRFFGDDLGSVVAVQPSLSDRHRGGRTVMALTFASGRKLLYKPKDLGTEAAYYRLLAWVNELGAPLPFRLLKVLDRSTHGWAEFVEHLPCRNRDEARRYYERAGMLLCLFYVLEVTDCHSENIIASGEHPVLIDTETLMHHRTRPQPSDEGARVLANEQLDHSVLRTGLLPRWEVSADGRMAYELSGLGGAVEQELPYRVPKWARVNTDRITFEQLPVTLPVLANVPSLDGAPLGLQDHGPQLVDGFRRMYRFLLDHREALLQSGPLRELAHEEVRFVYRPTKVYGILLSDLRDRRYLRDGADRSIYLEQLGRSQLPLYGPLPEERPTLWPVFAAERRAMEQGDVPFFTARAGSDALIVAPGQEIEDCFLEPSLESVLRRLKALGQEDLERQIAFIEGSLYAYSARDAAVVSRPTAQPPADESDASAEPPPPEAFVEPALALAEEIRARAILAEDRGATWISPQYLVEADRYQLQPMGYDLYGGTCGVSLFLAAAERFSPKEGYGELALAAVRPLRGELRERPQHLAQTMGIGGGSGLGSVVYSLVRMSRLLDEPALLKDARQLAGLITEDRIAADEGLDVLSGAAGAILGLIALYEALPDRAVLERATACGAHLIGAQTASEAGPRAWATLQGTLHTGFSHGAASIAYALLRLYEHTQDPRLLDAAQEGIAYEDAAYSPETGNWAAYRRQDEPSYAWQWCYGAPGIGLARLGGLGILGTEQVRRDVELALRATREPGLQPVDRLCCGNLGRTEVLLAAGERLSRRELSETARAHAWEAVMRAERAGGFVLDPLLPKQVDNTGFFRGTAGIGYGLLRMACPDLLPSVLMWE